MRSTFGEHLGIEPFGDELLDAQISTPELCSACDRMGGNLVVEGTDTDVLRLALGMLDKLSALVEDRYDDEVWTQDWWQNRIPDGDGGSRPDEIVRAWQETVEQWLLVASTYEEEIAERRAESEKLRKMGLDPF